MEWLLALQTCCLMLFSCWLVFIGHSWITKDPYNTWFTAYYSIPIRMIDHLRFCIQSCNKLEWSDLTIHSPHPPPPNKIFFKKINYRLIHFLHLPTPQIKQKLKEIKLQADSFLEIKPISNTTGKLYKKNRIILYQKNRRNTYKYTLYLLVITLQSSTEYFNNSKKTKGQLVYYVIKSEFFSYCIYF